MDYLISSDVTRNPKAFTNEDVWLSIGRWKRLNMSKSSIIDVRENPIQSYDEGIGDIDSPINVLSIK